MRKVLIYWVAGLALLNVGCMPAREHHAPLLTREEVIAIANRFASSLKIDLDNFDTPSAEFEYVAVDQQWYVFFDGKRPKAGNHFMVVVDDRTRETKLVRGL